VCRGGGKRNVLSKKMWETSAEKGTELFKLKPGGTADSLKELNASSAGILGFFVAEGECREETKTSEGGEMLGGTSQGKGGGEIN